MPDDAISGGTPPAQTDKQPKPFRISTILGPGAGDDESDPLLLAQISGTEAVSAPYAFDLTILQRTTNADGSSREKIEPTKLINTAASFGISEAENDGQFFNWHDRHGMIDRFPRRSAAIRFPISAAIPRGSSRHSSCLNASGPSAFSRIPTR